jgi:hypothetical protein
MKQQSVSMNSGMNCWYEAAICQYECWYMLPANQLPFGDALDDWVWVQCGSGSQFRNTPLDQFHGSGEESEGPIVLL